MSGKASLYLHHFGDAKKPSVLWLHGWLGGGREGEEVSKRLGDNVHLICPDLPGHGKTPIGSWDLNALLKDLATLASPCAGAIGYSMGGRLLMMSAEKHEAAYSAMIVESAHPGFTTQEERLEREQIDLERAKLLKEMGLPGFCQQWYRATMWDGILPPQRQGSPEELGEALLRFGLWRQPNLRTWLRTMQKPLLWLAGTRDPAYALLADWCSTSTCHQVERLETGHNIHIQQPMEWARLVTSFLSKHQYI